MSIDTSLINYPIKERLETKILIPEQHFLITLAQVIPWEEYAQLAIDDLYKNKRKSGRKLNIRLHLGAFILQTLFKWTDRELAENLNYYAPARVFCAIETKAYDHSAYVKFRGRISEETAKKFNISIIKVAQRRGFTGTQFMDFDSTVQEANIEYPSDIRMMQSIFRKGIKVLKGLSEAGSRKADKLLGDFNIKKITTDFKSYFFAKKSAAGFELKQKIFKTSYNVSKRITKSINSLDAVMKEYELPWNYKKDLRELKNVAPKLLEQINHFIKYGEVAPGKILSLHAQEVKCISKGKSGKPYEFGRKFFVGRLPGNYAFTFASDDVGLDDTQSMTQAMREYEYIFNEKPESISGDQGFWSRPNLKACEGVKEIGLTPRGHKNWKVSAERVDALLTRRSKVEPIIGHLKRRGMGRSKMKSDKTTRLVGQRSALSLNLSRIAMDLSDGTLKWAG